MFFCLSATRCQCVCLHCQHVSLLSSITVVSLNIIHLLLVETSLSFSALTLLVGRQVELPVCNKWVMTCWCGCLSRARCRLFVWSSWCHCIRKPHHLLPHLNSDWFYLSGTGLPRFSWNVVVVIETGTRINRIPQWWLIHNVRFAYSSLYICACMYVCPSGGSSLACLRLLALVAVIFSQPIRWRSQPGGRSAAATLMSLIHRTSTSPAHPRLRRRTRATPRSQNEPAAMPHHYRHCWRYRPWYPTLMSS